MTDNELIEKVKQAYLQVGKIPSRGVPNGISTYYASAAGALSRINGVKLNELPGETVDWCDGFINGFEWSAGRPRLEEYVRGLMQGFVVAESIFSWPKSPNVYSSPAQSEEGLESDLLRLSALVHSLYDEIKELKKTTSKE